MGRTVAMIIADLRGTQHPRSVYWRAPRPDGGLAAGRIVRRWFYFLAPFVWAMFGSIGFAVGESLTR